MPSPSTGLSLKVIWNPWCSFPIYRSLTFQGSCPNGKEKDIMFYMKQQPVHIFFWSSRQPLLSFILTNSYYWTVESWPSKQRLSVSDSSSQWRLRQSLRSEDLRAKNQFLEPLPSYPKNRLDLWVRTEFEFIFHRVLLCLCFSLSDCWWPEREPFIVADVLFISSLAPPELLIEGDVCPKCTHWWSISIGYPASSIGWFILVRALKYNDIFIKSLTFYKLNIISHSFGTFWSSKESHQSYVIFP